MKKIGILTQPLISNYGGILQNYALQQVLIRLDYEVETINRDQSKRSNLKVFFSKIKQLVFKHHSKKIIYEYQRRMVIKNSQNFIHKYITKTDVIVANNKCLREKVVSQKYDVLLVGSDQVWRPIYAIDIYQDYFSFAQDIEGIKRVSYAASFGTNEWEYTNEETIRCKELIQKFDAVSVRENSGLDLCSKYFNIKAEHVLDPTMLLSKEDYLTVINNKGIGLREGVFTYILDPTVDKDKIINTVANQLNKAVFKNQPEFTLDNNRNVKFKKERFEYPSIEGWLASFRDADFIITDSFHGTVFSIIFNKPFIAISNSARGKSRFDSLLKMFNLEDRLFTSYNANDIVKRLEKSIDYVDVNQKLDILKKKSISYLEKNL